MNKLIFLLAALALAGCYQETQAERDAHTHKVCQEAGLITREGVNVLGAVVLYCTVPEQEPQK